MHVYELENDRYGTILFSTLEKAKAQAIAYVKEWAEEQDDMDSEEFDGYIAEVQGWCDDNAIKSRYDKKWEFGDIAIIYELVVL